MKRLIAHVDMNSYFASVEQQANPFFRGKALGICAYLQEYGCIIAASIEAKRLGMKVGMTVQEARKQVPDAIFIENDPAKYRSVTTRIFSLLRTVSDAMKPYSIDEAFLDMTGWCRDEAEASFLFTRFKDRLARELGDWLPCSVGIAPTHFLAKLASERRKPNGLTIITMDSLDDVLKEMDLEDIAGIGKNMKRQFWKMGIFTPLDLRKARPMPILRSMGKSGYALWSSLQGEESIAMHQTRDLPKTIGHSYRVPRMANDQGVIPSIIARLIAKAGDRLRAKSLVAGKLSLIVGIHEERDYRHKIYTFQSSHADQQEFQRVALLLLHQLWNGERVVFIACTLLVLAPQHDQLVMDTMDRSSSVRSWIRFRDSTGGLLQVRNKYGSSALFLGAEWDAEHEDHAPDRIGFRKIEGAGYDGVDL